MNEYLSATLTHLSCIRYVEYDLELRPFNCTSWSVGTTFCRTWEILWSFVQQPHFVKIFVSPDYLVFEFLILKWQGESPVPFGDLPHFWVISPDIIQTDSDMLTSWAWPLTFWASQITVVLVDQRTKSELSVL